MKRDPKPPLLSSVVPAWAQGHRDTSKPPVVASSPSCSPAEFVSSSTTLFRVNEAAAGLNVSSKTVRRLIVRGDLKVIRIGRSVRIHSSEIERLIARGGAHEAGSGIGESYD